MDLKKEIKLSDLVRRPKKKTQAPGVTKPWQRDAQAGPEAGDRRPQDRRLPDRRLARRQQRRPGEARAARARPARARRRRRRRGARHPRARVGARPSSSARTSCRGAASASASPRTGSACARSSMEGIEDERQLANAIRFRAHEALSIPADEAVLDYHVVSESVDESGQRSRRVVLAAAYRDSIDHYVAACKEAGIELAAVDLEAFALLRAVAPARRDATSRPPSSRSRSATTARRSRSPTASSATSRASSSGAARTSRPRSPASSA